MVGDVIKKLLRVYEGIEQIFGRMLELQMQMVYSFYDLKIHAFSI